MEPIQHDSPQQLTVVVNDVRDLEDPVSHNLPPQLRDVRDAEDPVSPRGKHSRYTTSHDETRSHARRMVSFVRVLCISIAILTIVSYANCGNSVMIRAIWGDTAALGINISFTVLALVGLVVATMEMSSVLIAAYAGFAFVYAVCSSVAFTVLASKNTKVYKPCPVHGPCFVRDTLEIRQYTILLFLLAGAIGLFFATLAQFVRKANAHAVCQS